MQFFKSRIHLKKNITAVLMISNFGLTERDFRELKIRNRKILYL
ncbi:hypothetical protein LEP1GSC060_2076 [Leptospira weilii serovar Ranarum str. ICFT]|uniref:Uncharacterized protein n=1 Tax=Leptospira weilii serovar Ranarum str. ICFT TaxID=1218598 RepID=N1WIE8_9LEPT|nr:hypothetical protein LEP1GSC060_2076 [Leptospira weilii serovar Ranarum str. ICFT]